MGGFFGNLLDTASHGGKPSSEIPPPLDVVGAAKETGASNLANTRLQATMNRPNESNPFGSRTWTQGPNDTWSLNTTLNSADQQQLDRTRRLQAGLGGIAEGNIGNYQSMFSNPLMAPSGDANSRNSVENALSSRLEPQFARDEEAMRSRLANQGIMQGSEAYNNDYDAFNRSKNDARMQTILAGGQEQTRQGQELSRQFGLQQQARNQSLGELSALRGDTNMPQFQAYSGVGAAQSPDLAGATSSQNAANIGAWSAQQAQQQQMRQGLYGLAGAFF